MRVLCFGDSNTYGYDPRSYLGGRYPADSRWVDILSGLMDCDVINGGENGREIPARAAEWEQFTYLLSKSNPDLLIVMLGGNDLLQGASAEEAAVKMENFLRRVPLLPEQIILISPPPLIPGAWVSEERLLTESVRLGELYGALAQRLGITCLNAGEWGVSVAYDGVHFDAKGHRNFASELHQALLKKQNV